MMNKELKIKIDEIEKTQKPKFDLFDFWMLKYRSWVRIGTNRCYFKKGENDLFHLLCIYNIESISTFLAAIELGTMKEEDFAKKIPMIEFNGELMYCDSVKDLLNAIIYTIAGCFSDFRKIEGKNKEIYDMFMEIIKSDKNEKYPTWAIGFKNEKSEEA